MTELHTIGAAAIAGLVTSVHCAGMCGPLACSVAAGSNGGTERQLAQISYHSGRLFSYTLIGGLCGFLGAQPLRWVFDTPAVVFPWLLGAIFLFTALGVWKRIPRPPALDRVVARARLRALRLSATRGGLALGLATPLLPCGPLYLLFGASLVTGSAVRGAEFGLAFGIGTIPLLWLVQESLGRLRGVIPAMRLIYLQRGLALLAALLVFWRLHDTLPSGTDRVPGSNVTETGGLPTCCPPKEL